MTNTPAKNVHVAPKKFLTSGSSQADGILTESTANKPNSDTTASLKSVSHFGGSFDHCEIPNDTKLKLLKVCFKNAMRKYPNTNANKENATCIASLSS